MVVAVCSEGELWVRRRGRVFMAACPPTRRCERAAANNHASQLPSFPDAFSPLGLGWPCAERERELGLTLFPRMRDAPCCHSSPLQSPPVHSSPLQSIVSPASLCTRQRASWQCAANGSAAKATASPPHRHSPAQRRFRYAHTATTTLQDYCGTVITG